MKRLHYLKFKKADDVILRRKLEGNEKIFIFTSFIVTFIFYNKKIIIAKKLYNQSVCLKCSFFNRYIV